MPNAHRHNGEYKRPALGADRSWLCHVAEIDHSAEASEVVITRDVRVLADMPSLAGR